MQTYAEQLRQIRDSLTPENWHKGSYFASKNNTLCMCVHGAARLIVNPSLKTDLEAGFLAPLSAPARESNAVSDAANADRARAYTSTTISPKRYCYNDINALNQDLFSVWKNRPYSVKATRVMNDFNHGNTNIHYLMGMFGITAKFNDHPNTTLEMIKTKLSEAVDWAEENEEFLQNN